MQKTTACVSLPCSTQPCPRHARQSPSRGPKPSGCQPAPVNKKKVKHKSRQRRSTKLSEAEQDKKKKKSQQRWLDVAALRSMLDCSQVIIACPPTRDRLPEKANMYYLHSSTLPMTCTETKQKIHTLTTDPTISPPLYFFQQSTQLGA